MKYLETFQFFIEKMALNNYDEYAELVAKAYEDAALYDENIIPSYKSLIDHAERLYKQIIGKGIDVQFVDDDPYTTRNEMANDVNENGVLKITKLFNEHPYFTKEQNLKFRAVHDYYTHIICNQDFGLRGELKAYNTHARLAPVEALPALFTEVVGQVCYAIVNGKVDEKGDFVPAFGEQKIVALPGFDYRNVGEVKDREIVNKKLI
jgi:hypothetical protein